MAADVMTDRERFFGQLPFYANGTLPQPERAWMDEMASKDAALNTALANEAHFAQRVREAIDAVEPQMGTAQALIQARATWKKERAKWAWWHRITQSPKWLIGVLATMSLAQWAYIATVTTGVALAPSRSLPPECRMEPRVQVALRPDARWEDAVVMMRSHGLLLREGPNEHGQIWLAVPTGKTAEAVVAALAAEKLVDLAEVSAPAKAPECTP